MTEMNNTREYIERLIKTHEDREKPKGEEGLACKQKEFYKTIKAIAKDNNNKVMSKKIKEKYPKPSYQLTDFCYDKVNQEDVETKFLISSRKSGKFEFVGFNWQAKDKQVEITWIPRGQYVPIELEGKPFTVGKYQNGKYSWNFKKLMNIYNL